MKVNTLIIDDSCHDSSLIQKELLSVLKEYQFELSCDFANCYSEDLDIINYDIFVLDIDIPQMNGFDISYEIRKTNKRAIIIFCTNHPELVFESLRIGAFYFVRKDHLVEDLHYAIDKYYHYSRTKNQAYIVKHNDEIIKVPFESIKYFEISKNTLYIHTTTQKYQERKSFSRLTQELPPDSFLCISQSYLVNYDMVTKLNKNKLILTNGEELFISRSKLDSVKEQYLLHMVK